MDLEKQIAANLHQKFPQEDIPFLRNRFKRDGMILIAEAMPPEIGR